MPTDYEIYKLDHPQSQVGMPNDHKWAVGKKTAAGLSFVDAFRTKRAAKKFIEENRKSTGGQPIDA